MLDQSDEKLVGQDFAVQHNKLADGAVIGLMTATQPPRANVAPRQSFQFPQRPLPVDNPIDDKPKQRARMKGLASGRLIATDQRREVQLAQQGRESQHPA
jgi:hypothetical protein